MRNERPFAAGAAAQHILDTQLRRETLARLCDGLGAREPFLLVTGEAGVGKTTFVRDAVAIWDKRVTVAFIANPALSRAELVEEVARRFGAEPPAGGSKPQLLACLERVLADVAAGGRTAVLIVDDAHDLAPELIEELRLIANAESRAGRPFEVLLAGLPALETRLAEPDLAAVRQRVSVHCHIRPLSHKETRRHLQETAGRDGARVFPRDTCREIFQLTHGVPRAVNALADDALRRARAAGAGVVDRDHVAAAAKNAPNTKEAPKSDAPAPARPEQATAPKPEAHAAPKAQAHAAPKPEAPAATPAETPAPAKAAATTPAAEPDVPAAAEAVTHDAPRTGDTPPPSAATPVGDERVKSWVSRFIAEDEPRFGARFAMDSLDDVVEVVVTPHRRRKDADITDAAEAEAHAVEAAPAPTTPDAPSAAAEEAPAPRRHDAPRKPARRKPVATDHELEDDHQRRRHGSNLVPVLIAFVGLAALAAVILLPRAGLRLSSGGGTRAVSSTTAKATPAPAGDGGGDPVATRTDPDRAAAEQPAPARTTARQPQATPRGTASTPATSPASRTAPASATDSAPDAPAAAPGQLLALDVGSYINPDRAAYERTRLGADSGLQAWIVRGEQGGATTYRVVLGIFSTPERAQRSAEVLLERGLVTEATTIPLPPRSTRQ